MKKKITAIVTIVLSVALIATSIVLYHINKESEYALGISFNNEKELLGLIYIGGSEDTYDYTVVDKYYTSAEQESFTTADLGGEELYLVIPRYNVETYLNKLEMTQTGGTNKEMYMMSMPPFFIKCNVSDIFANAEITFNYKGKTYTYSPYISLKDGSVVVEDFVCLIGE